MYFITNKDSETGLKFAAIEKKMDDAIQAQKTMAKKYGIKEWRRAHWGVAGRFSSVIFAETPDLKVWKRVNGENEFMPKLNTKEGKVIDAEFSKMPWVPYWKLNECVGIDINQWGNIGVTFRHPHLYGFSVPEEWKFECPGDCEEITTSKYKEIFDYSEQS